MTTDRELLEAAARAAGIELVWLDDVKPGQPVNFTEALGALELVKLDLYDEMKKQ